MSPVKETTAKDVLLFIPNLIGYMRVVATLVSFVLMIVSSHSFWWLAILLYVSSFVGDLLDGMAARKFNQCSTFGGLLDMVTDRCSTLGMLYILGGEYQKEDEQIGVPLFQMTFLFLIVLDISSHWCQMHSTMSLNQQAHHKSKESNADRNILVRLYYQYYWFFGYCCVGAEFTYICLYIRQYVSAESLLATVNTVLLYSCLPGCVTKQVVNVAQLTSACHAVAAHDAHTRNTRLQKQA